MIRRFAIAALITTGIGALLMAIKVGEPVYGSLFGGSGSVLGIVCGGLIFRLLGRYVETRPEVRAVSSLLGGVSAMAVCKVITDLILGDTRIGGIVFLATFPIAALVGFVFGTGVGQTAPRTENG